LGIATAWLPATGWAFHVGATRTGYLLGVPLILLAALVSITHICILSLIYNTLFRTRGLVRT
jgi:type IV secretory pathway VirB3-like protein